MAAPSTITVRPAREHDARFIVECFVRSMEASITLRRGVWDEARERTGVEQALDLDRTSVIEASGSAVGFVMLAEPAGALQIHTLAILPAYQRQGLGSEIVRDLIAIGRQTNRDVVLSVLKVNARAEAFYTRLGFVVVDESDSHRHLRFAPARPSR